MKAWEEDGYWYVHVSGGQIGDRNIEPEDVGPLVEPPRLLMEWTQSESDRRGSGGTTFKRLESGWYIFTVRHYRWSSASGDERVEFEIVMRDPTVDEFLNPDPPPWVEADRYQDGWLLL